MPNEVTDRPTYQLKKFRAEDLAEGDVSRDGVGKWATVTGVEVSGRVTTLRFDSDCSLQTRSVDLREVQVVKNS